MEIKTDSGVSITIISEGSSKVMVFSKPVRVIELKRQESSQMSAILAATTKKRKKGQTQEITPELQRNNRKTFPH